MSERATVFENVKSYEPVTQSTVDMLIRTLGRLTAMVCGLNEVDLTKGAGVIDGHTKCLWTKERNRITIISKNGIIAHKSRDPDPECPK